MRKTASGALNSKRRPNAVLGQLSNLSDDSVTPLESGVFLGRCLPLGAMPAQKLVNTVAGMIGKVG